MYIYAENKKVLTKRFFPKEEKKRFGGMCGLSGYLVMLVMDEGFELLEESDNLSIFKKDNSHILFSTQKSSITISIHEKNTELKYFTSNLILITKKNNEVIEKNYKNLKCLF